MTNEISAGATRAARGWRVLVAEDNPTNQRVATYMLKHFGCEVEIAGDGAKAVAAWHERRFDLIVMDCQMPAMDGFEATRAIRDAEGGDAHIPIVAATANALDGDRERCLAAGMDDYVSKPITKSEIGGVLDRLVEKGLLGAGFSQPGPSTA